MQRLIIVYNPRSSKHSLIEEEVLSPATKYPGYAIGKFEVKSVPVDQNAKNLSKILLDDDLVVAAGGDGTGAVALNGAILSQKSVTLAILGYGNFNDFARTLGYQSISEILSDFKSKKSSLKTLYPLEALVDGKHFRFAACYFTIGMFAESTLVFDQKSTRKSLKTGKKSLFYSISTLAKWYFKNKHHQFLPASFRLNGEAKTNISDVLFVNGKTVAKMMRGDGWWQDEKAFLVSSGKLTKFLRLLAFMAKSIFKRLPGTVQNSPCTINFDHATEIEIQGEGEYRRLKLSQLTIKKSEQGIKVLSK
ncbi:hypothetical protein IK112_01110 [Candidatus Saccharibacteria bacterium]|nr:hypothetical protein [Candidatus Saccharibacteria bacterium]